MKDPKTGIIVLAAGFSSRMGDRNKLLLPWKNSTIVGNVIAQVADLGVTVVVSSRITDIPGPGNFRVVQNHFPERGMTESIKCGIRALPQDLEGYVICPGDLPFTTSVEYDQIIGFFRKKVQEDAAAIVVPFHGNQSGHPVIFSVKYRDKILDHSNPDGCREIIRDNSKHVFRIEMEKDHVVRDIDTFETYRLAQEAMGR